MSDLYCLAGELLALLLCAVVRVAVLVPHIQFALQSTPALDTNFSGKTSLLARLTCHLPNEINVKNGEVPLRCDVEFYIEVLSSNFSVDIHSSYSLLNYYFYKIGFLVYPSSHI